MPSDKESEDGSEDDYLSDASVKSAQSEETAFTKITINTGISSTDTEENDEGLDPDDDILQAHFREALAGTSWEWSWSLGQETRNAFVQQYREHREMKKAKRGMSGQSVHKPKPKRLEYELLKTAVRNENQCPGKLIHIFEPIKKPITCLIAVYFKENWGSELHAVMFSEATARKLGLPHDSHPNAEPAGTHALVPSTSGQEPGQNDESV